MYDKIKKNFNTFIKHLEELSNELGYSEEEMRYIEDEYLMRNASQFFSTAMYDLFNPRFDMMAINSNKEDL